MTIAIGMVCADGVLVASDSMGSSGTVATHIEKARALAHNPLVWAVSGSAFIAQRIERAITPADDAAVGGLTTEKLAAQLCPIIRTAYATPAIPPGATESDSSAHAAETLISSWRDGEASLLHLPADLAAVECRDRNFVAIGSGHEFASAAYATLSHYLRVPITLQLANLLAYRIIATVCNVSSWGVALPVQLAVAD